MSSVRCDVISRKIEGQGRVCTQRTPVTVASYGQFHDGKVGTINDLCKTGPDVPEYYICFVEGDHGTGKARVD
jgi:hypothetical protein